MKIISKAQTKSIACEWEDYYFLNINFHFANHCYQAF